MDESTAREYGITREMELAALDEYLEWDTECGSFIELARKIYQVMTLKAEQNISD